MQKDTNFQGSERARQRRQASGKGELRLLKWVEMPRARNPEADTRVSVKESCNVYRFKQVEFE